jgi:hypothetical protein
VAMADAVIRGRANANGGAVTAEEFAAPAAEAAKAE